MAVLSFGEVFGHATDDTSSQAKKARQSKPCPFRGRACDKVNKDMPLGICGLANETHLTVTCPNRFREDDRLFRDAARLAFKQGEQVVVVPEIRILRSSRKSNRKIGKIDYLIGRETPGGQVEDFAALEVQAVYISGRSVRPAFDDFLQTGKLSENAVGRPDFRSSQKRLMPQLNLKVPVFRRWGKNFFVAVDRSFFEALPPFRRANSLDNSEVTWLVYPFERNREGAHYAIGEPEVVFSGWDDVQEALREGEAPSPSEVMAELSGRAGAIRFSL